MLSAPLTKYSHMMLKQEVEEMDIGTTKIEIPIVEMTVRRFEIGRSISGLETFNQ